MRPYTLSQQFSQMFVVQGSDLQLDVHDANEPNILEAQHLPDTEVLAEGFRGCLQVCLRQDLHL